MKLFTGSLAAGLVLLAGGAQAQVPRALHGGIGCRRPPMRWRRMRRFPGRTTDPGRATDTARACCRRRKSIPCCAITDSRRSASRRLRGFVYTIAAIDRGGADGRLIIDARNGRIIRFLPAYRMGGDNYYEEQSALRGPSRGSAAAGPAAAGPGAGSGPGRAAAVTAGPMSRAARCRCRRPARSPPSLRPAPVQQAAAPAPKPAEVPARRPGDNRLGSSQARPADCADPGHADGAGAGVTSTVVPAFAGTTNKKNAPVFPGRFHCGKLRAIRARLRRPGSGRRPCRAARPATGGRRPVRPSSHSCAWRETARGRD